jgi:RNA polymerase sigma-70 factor (ECF subfamily)
MSDKDDLIVAGVNQKDKGIWRDFYNRYYAALCSYVEKILFLTDAVEDLVQEVFISVWEGKRTFSDSRELTNYLYRACYNNALLYIRNHQIHDSILNGLPQEEDFEDEEMLYALTVKEEAIRQLYFYIEELPAEQRRIILLRIEGHSWDEIASRLGVSTNTACHKFANWTSNLTIKFYWNSIVLAIIQYRITKQSYCRHPKLIQFNKRDV